MLGPSREVRRLGRPRWGALSNANFRWLQAGNVVTNTGTFFEQVAASWLVYHLTGSAAWVGMQSFAVNAPTLFTALPAGAWADRWNRRRAMLQMQLLWTALAALMAVLSGFSLLTGSLIVIITAMEGVLAGISRPFWNVVAQDVVGREQLGSAIAFNSAAFNVARLVGPALGGIILEEWGPTASFSLNTLSFTVVIYAIWRLRLPRRAEKRHAPMGAEIRGGLRYARCHPGFFRLFWGAGVFAFLVGPVQGILVVFAREALGGEARLYGALLSAMAVGAIGGALVAGKGPHYLPRHRLISIAAFAYGVIGCALSMTRTPQLALPLMACVGLCHSTFFVSSMTAVQLMSPEALRGRLLSIQSLVTLGLLPIGSALGGILAERIGSPQTLGIFMTALVAHGFYLNARPVAFSGEEHALAAGRGAPSHAGSPRTDEAPAPRA